MTAIEWTDTTWNPVTGCTKISPGCDNCYAERFSNRFAGVSGHPFEQGFSLTLRPERIDQPRSWKKPRMVFVNSMSDLFHKDIPKEFVDRVFDTMEDCEQHTFQVLTKRSSIMRSYVNDRFGEKGCPSHIWLGVSVETNQQVSRANHLKSTNAAVRFLSAEPLIGSLDTLDVAGIQWVIVGGESGPKARPMKEEWAVEILKKCLREDVAFFFKQWGGFRPKTGGRMLQGKEWDQFPIVGHA